MRPFFSALLSLVVTAGGIATATAQPTAEDCLSPDAARAQAIARDLLDWIAARTDYDTAAARAEPPWIVFCQTGDSLSYEGSPITVEPSLRAAYDARSRRIYLVAPWDPDDTFARSVLLHELIHDVQHLNRDWPCIGAPEWEAYELQDQWLRERDIHHDFDWLAIYFLSRCPRDVHP